MIIGSGLLARAFPEYEDSKDVIIFASGVSDPEEGNGEEFDREEDLLIMTMGEHPEKKLVYFGTTSSRNTPYVHHKYEMENLVQEHPSWLLFKLGPVYSDNPMGYTFYDVTYNKILNDQVVELWAGQSRPIIHISDVQIYVRTCLLMNLKNVTTSLIGRYKTVEEIVEMIEKQLNKKAKVKYV